MLPSDVSTADVPEMVSTLYKPLLHVCRASSSALDRADAAIFMMNNVHAMQARPRTPLVHVRSPISPIRAPCPAVGDITLLVGRRLGPAPSRAVRPPDGRAGRGQGAMPATFALRDGVSCSVAAKRGTGLTLPFRPVSCCSTWV